MSLTTEHIQLIGNLMIIMSILGGVVGVVFGNEMRNENRHIMRLINTVTEVKLPKRG